MADFLLRSFFDGPDCPHPAVFIFLHVLCENEIWLTVMLCLIMGLNEVALDGLVYLIERKK